MDAQRQNEDVLARCGVEKPVLLEIIEEMKKRFLEEKKDSVFGFGLVHCGMIPGKATRGRRRSTLRDGLQ